MSHVPLRPQKMQGYSHLFAFPLEFEVERSHRRDFSGTDMCLRFGSLQRANLSDSDAPLFTRAQLILGLPLPQAPLQLSLDLRRNQNCTALGEALQQR